VYVRTLGYRHDIDSPPAPTLPFFTFKSVLDAVAGLQTLRHARLAPINKTRLGYPLVSRAAVKRTPAHVSSPRPGARTGGAFVFARASKRHALATGAHRFAMKRARAEPAQTEDKRETGRAGGSAFRRSWKRDSPAMGNVTALFDLLPPPYEPRQSEDTIWLNGLPADAKVEELRSVLPQSAMYVRIDDYSSWSAEPASSSPVRTPSFS
jgi:hypothetical protein